MRFISYFVFSAMLAVGFAAESASSKSSKHTEPKVNKGRYDVSVSSKCSKTIVKLCSQLTDEKLADCEKRFTKIEDVEYCIMKSMGSREDVDRCEAENLDFLIKKGCDHLQCKRLSRDLCGCTPYPTNGEEHLCWHTCYYSNINEFKKYDCERPPMDP